MNDDIEYICDLYYPNCAECPFYEDYCPYEEEDWY